MDSSFDGWRRPHDRHQTAYSCHTTLSAYAMMDAVTEARLIRITGVLFVIGSALFALGVLLQLPAHVPALLGGVCYAVGAVFFTVAAACQTKLAVRDLPSAERSWFRWRGLTTDVVAAVVQLVGTVLFNLNTIDYCLTLDASARIQDVTVWVPDTVGSIAFLVSSGLAMAPEVRARRHAHVPDRSYWIAALNLAGSALFGVSASSSFVLRTGELVSLWWTNAGTFGGAVCFLVAAWLFAGSAGGPGTRTAGATTAASG